MRLQKVCVLAVAALLALAPARANAATITFDDVASGTVINNFYAATGVTFACSDGSFAGICNSFNSDGTNVYALASSVNNSPGNVVSTFPMGFAGERENLTGTIQATFVAPVSSVSIDAYAFQGLEGFGQPGVGYVSAFNGATLLGTTTTAGYGTWQTLSLSFASITHVQFSSTVGGFPSYAIFDNLTFSTTTDPGPGPTDPAPVPEPASSTLMAMGLLGMIASRYKRSAS
jgi:hypothetical protein